ncbi:exosortase A [Desulfosarcina ovata subsp. sediminis]|uniref:Exosortase A n=2 Tax=Desulfosarcina ovata TaxID=83564 RepID=A0A5K7ZMC8_9BACT|nr:exosortase A [Desulfosarcina ovata subsp. sediminis]
MKSEEYSHAILVLPIILYMIWTKRTALYRETGKDSPIGLALAFVSTAFYLFAIRTQVQTLLFLSMCMTMIGSIVYLTGTGAIKSLATPLLLFMMLIPIPEQLYPQITFPLQLKVSQASEIIVRAFGIPLLREGNVMHLPGKSFEVVEACSGLRSAISLLTLSVIMGYFMLQRYTSKTILFAASIPTAIFINIVRVVSMLLMFHYYHIDLSKGALHTGTGLFVFALAIIIFFILQRLLERWESKAK